MYSTAYHETADGKHPILLVEVPQARLQAAEQETEQQAGPLDEDQFLRADLHEHLRQKITNEKGKTLSGSGLLHGSKTDGCEVRRAAAGHNHNRTRGRGARSRPSRAPW